MNYLYLVDYWIPFPTSEYDSRIMERVVNAHKFALANDEESRIVDTFTT